MQHADLELQQLCMLHVAHSDTPLLDSTTAPPLALPQTATHPPSAPRLTLSNPRGNMSPSKFSRDTQQSVKVVVADIKRVRTSFCT